VLPERLVEDLTAHRIMALRTVLFGNSEIALAAVVHALALPLFYGYGGDSCLTVRFESSAPVCGTVRQLLTWVVTQFEL
jgi:ParB family chromosome partitioning protein